MMCSTVVGVPAAAVAALRLLHLLQRCHAILRNFPVIGHRRYLLESIGRKLRGYITTRNDEEPPFTRDQRRWVHASSKRVTNTFGFGTDIEFTDGYTIMKHRTFSQFPPSAAPARRRAPADSVGEDPRPGRAAREALRQDSIVTISA